MVDINTSRSALQAQLQASQQAKVSARPSYTGTQPQTQREAFPRKVEDRADLTAPDRRSPAKQSHNARTLSSAQELEDAGQKAANFGNSLREAPNGRTSQSSIGPARNQPLGQIVNILV